MKSWIKDVLIVIILLSVGLLSGYILYLDRTSDTEYKGTQPVGRVVNIKNESIRIPGDRAREFSLKKPGDVYLYETLKVSSKKGSQIVLKLSNEYYHVENEIVLHEGAVIKFTPEGFRTEGTVTIETASGEMEKITGNFEATIEEDGINIKTVKIVAQYPVNTEIIVTEAEYPLQFQWREEEPVTDKFIQISYRQDFSKILITDEIPDENTYITEEMSPGTYYWRIVGDSYGKHYVGPESVFTLYRYAAPVLIEPADMQEIVYYNKLNIDLRWGEAVLYTGQTDINADFYLLDITRDGSFNDYKPIILGQKTKYIVTQELLNQEGTYQWRITPSFEIVKDFTGGASRFQNLIVKERKTLAFKLSRSQETAPLELNYPLNGDKFNVLDVRNGISFNWEKDRETDNFRFQIASDRNFNNIVLDDITDYYSYMFNGDIPPGTYYWRVEGLVTGTKGRLSEIRSFSVKELEGGIALIYPDSGRVIELNPDNPQVTFKWQTDLPATEYRLVLYKGNSDTPFIRENTKETTIRWNLSAPEDFGWQVILLDEIGRVIKSSPVQNFRTIRPFRAPLLIYPAKDQALSFRGEKETTFFWEKVQTADSYGFQLYSAGSDRPLLTAKTDRTEIRIEDLSVFTPGQYVVSLQSFRGSPPAGLSGESTVSLNSFSVDEVIFYSAPIPVTPTDGSGTDILSVRKNGINFSWRQAPQMPQFYADIYRDDNPASPYKTVQTDKTGFTLNDLDKGSYFWRIRSMDESGRPAPDSVTSRFRITDIPSLPDPVVLSPRDGSGINMEDYDRLDFSWTYVNGADFYRIKLYDLKNGRAVLEDTVSGTEYSLSDLELLDVGTFYFEVQAYKENKNIAVPTPQFSKVVRSTFSIYLQEAYESPNIISPDKQYTR